MHSSELTRDASVNAENSVEKQGWKLQITGEIQLIHPESIKQSRKRPDMRIQFANPKAQNGPHCILLDWINRNFFRGGNKMQQTIDFCPNKDIFFPAAVG